MKLLTVVIFLGIIHLALFLLGCDKGYDPTYHYKTGDVVKIVDGFYSDCHGTVVRDAFSMETKDRFGVLHPAAFAGYVVAIENCNGQTGERFFTSDFLRLQEKPHGNSEGQTDNIHGEASEASS